MTFSAKVKEELAKKTDGARHCQLAEFLALMSLLGKISDNEYTSEGSNLALEFTTENELVADRFLYLLDTLFNIREGSRAVRKCIPRDKQISILILDEKEIVKIMMALKWCDDEFNSIETTFADGRIVAKECCKKAFIRGAFLATGSVSDPSKYYHYEIVCPYEEDAEVLKSMLVFFGLDAKIVERKASFIVYLKEGNNITDALNLMGACVSQMDMVNIMILKDMRNNVNRRVNCETANLNKTVAAAVKQVADIEFIERTVGLDYLNPTLSEIAYLRLANQDTNLAELGAMLDPPVGKSGVNHRLRRISEIAEELRISRGER